MSKGHLQAKVTEKSIGPKTIKHITCLMDNFEKQFENLVVQLNVMDGTMSQTTATNASQDVVETLMKQSAEVVGILETITCLTDTSENSLKICVCS